MDARIRYRVLIPALVALAPLVSGRAQQLDSLPAGVTPAMIAQGKKIFGGDGLCFACHGPEARGLVGPDLTDAIWLSGTGSYDEIVARILTGVPADQSKSGQIMPPKGGASLNEKQVKAVAAYVWSLSRKPPQR